jgi:hypothetical protein
VVTAIINQLKTGSIKTVKQRGSTKVNLQPPYVIVWGPELIQKPGYENRGKNQYFIAAHFKRGFGNQLDDYIIDEVVTLLNKQILTTRDLRDVRLKVSGGPSNMIEGHDDKTISKERIFITAAIYD